MTLSGRAAQQRPDIDALAPTAIAVVTHLGAPGPRGTTARQTLGADRADVLGRIGPDTGAYTNIANGLTEKARRELRLRRNGRPRR